MATKALAVQCSSSITSNRGSGWEAQFWLKRKKGVALDGTVHPCAPLAAEILRRRRVQAAESPAAFAVATAIGLVAFGNQSVIKGIKLSFFRMALWMSSSSSPAIRFTAMSSGRAAAEESASAANSRAFNKAKAKLWGTVLFPFSTGTQPLAMASRAQAPATVRNSSSLLRSSTKMMGQKMSKGRESFCGCLLAAYDMSRASKRSAQHRTPASKCVANCKASSTPSSSKTWLDVSMPCPHIEANVHKQARCKGKARASSSAFAWPLKRFVVSHSIIEVCPPNSMISLAWVCENQAKWPNNRISSSPSCALYFFGPTPSVPHGATVTWRSWSTAGLQTPNIPNPQKNARA